MSAGRDEIGKTPRADVIGLRPSETIPRKDRSGFLEVLFEFYCYKKRNRLPRNVEELWNFGAEEFPDLLEGWTLAELCEDHPDGSLPELLEVFSEGIEDSLEYKEWRTYDGTDEPEWIIPGVLAKAERMIVTGKPGAGKSLFCEQIAVQVASGIHPFTGEEIRPRRVLLVDFENPEDEVTSRLTALKELAGNQWNSRLIRSLCLSAADLEDEDSRDELAERCRGVDLVVIGPLYKLDNGPQNEDITTRRFLDWIDSFRKGGHTRTIRDPFSPFSYTEVRRFGAAVILEGHPTKGKGERGPSGHANLQRWPEVGIQLEPGSGGTVKVHQWRTPRRSKGITIPTQLERDAEWNRSLWPFRPSNRTAESSGGTSERLEAAIVAVLDRAGEDGISKSKLGEQLRAGGISFPNDSLGAVLDSLEQSGTIRKRSGSRDRIRLIRNDPDQSGDSGGSDGESSERSSAPGFPLGTPGADDPEDSLDPDDPDLEWSEWSAEDDEPDEPWEMEGTFRRPNDF